jgi:uncharacterized protein YdeI (YjbR/CyaY-like superfamily)
MTPSPLQSFTAVLEPLRSRLNWVIVRIPFEVAKVWPVRKRQRVRGSIEGFAFRTSLFAFSSGEGHFLLINSKMQQAAKAKVGSKVRIQLEPDLDARPAIIPPELLKEFKGLKTLRKWFDALSESMRREIGAWVGEPKTAATRELRAVRMAERLMLAMEGEAELPPVLRAAFLQQPLAQRGWEAMTPAQRRGHLLGIFYYQSVEAQQRRVAKAVEEALRLSHKEAGLAEKP